MCLCVAVHPTKLPTNLNFHLPLCFSPHHHREGDFEEFCPTVLKPIFKNKYLISPPSKPKKKNGVDFQELDIEPKNR